VGRPVGGQQCDGIQTFADRPVIAQRMMQSVPQQPAAHAGRTSVE
jgi:hypothetical protein